MKKTMIHLVGVDSSGALSDKTLALIQNAGALVVSRRHQARLVSILPDLPVIIPIAPVQTALDQLALALKKDDVVVLATGDPLFFGIGRTLLHLFASERILIYPALSSMQLAFSRFKIAWDDAAFLSLHGRIVNNLAASILSRDKTFLFTDQVHSPDLLAQSLLAECGKEINKQYIVHVAENLGMAEEHLYSGTLADIAEQTFSRLTVMILVKNSAAAQMPGFGLTEDEIIHSRGLITKNEVRAASLHNLRLPRQGVLWDIGAGSGSIGLEAARLFPELQVCAVEQKDEQIENIRRNRQHFQAWNLQIFPGQAQEILTALPAPDRVFIGGSGGQLQTIIQQATQRLLPGGRIVINAVLEKTAQEAPRYLHENGLKVSLSELKVTRQCYPQTRDCQTMHTITIIVGQKINQEIKDE